MTYETILNDNTDKYQLKYFNFRGVAEPARLIFKLKGIPFEDVRLEKDETWTNEHKQNTPWGLLPVLTVNGVEICQSAAIARYLANKFDLVGNNDIEAALCDELVDSMVDLRLNWRSYWRESNEIKKMDFKNELLSIHFPKYFKKYTEMLEQNDGEWLVSNRLTWADLYIAHFLEFFELTVDPEVLEPYQALKTFKLKILSIPEIKEWIDSRPNTIL